MNESTTYDRVVNIIARHSTASADEMTRTSDIREDLAMDSLAQVELIMALEDEFEMDIPDESAGLIDTIGELVDFIDS